MKLDEIEKVCLACIEYARVCVYQLDYIMEIDGVPINDIDFVEREMIMANILIYNIRFINDESVVKDMLTICFSSILSYEYEKNGYDKMPEFVYNPQSLLSSKYIAIVIAYRGFVSDNFVSLTIGLKDFLSMFEED